jgi:hypothetical protein
MKLVGMMMLFVGISGSAFAGVVLAPEIDASSATAAVTLITGGLLVLRARRRK